MKNYIIILFGASVLNAAYEIHCPAVEDLKQRSSTKGPWMTTFGETLGPAGTEIEVSHEDIKPEGPWRLIRAQLNTNAFTQILNCVYEGTSNCKYKRLYRYKSKYPEKFSLIGVIDRNDCTMPKEKGAKHIVCP